MKKYLFILALLTSLPLFAQKTKKVEGEYVYHVPENVTPEAAKRTALNRAKIHAIANGFGEQVSSINDIRVENQDGRSEVSFVSVGGSEVRAEWIETIGEPQFKRYFDDNDELIIVCKVRGKAREIVSAGIDLKFHVLCNGTEDKFESDRFKDGDGLYLSFFSPVKGYLAVYLVDENQQASCLLPYMNQETGMYSIEANHRYVFFNQKEATQEERPYVDEYFLFCSQSSSVQNHVYIIFSPNQFSKASDERVGELLPRQLPFRDFQRWYVKCRDRDKDMNVKIVPIMIEK